MKVSIYKIINLIYSIYVVKTMVLYLLKNNYEQKCVWRTLDYM